MQGGWSCLQLLKEAKFGMILSSAWNLDNAKIMVTPQALEKKESQNERDLLVLHTLVFP